MEYFDYDSVTPNEEFSDIESFLERSHQRERGRIEKMLQEIDAQLEERDRIHSDLTDELESKLDWYVERLEMHYRRGSGKRNSDREELKQRIEQFYQELREERRERWKDQQKLENERRSLLRELEEVTDSPHVFEMLDDPW